MKNILFFFLTISLTFFSIAFSQTTTGNIEGQVLNPEKNSLSGVNITLSNESVGQLQGTASNDRGYFIISGLPVGHYDVKIQHLGYQEIVLKNVQINLGKTTSLGIIVMKDKILDSPEIVVYGDKPIIDFTSTSIGENLSTKDYESLPTTRDYRSIVTLMPHANTSYYGDEINIGGNSG